MNSSQVRQRKQLNEVKEPTKDEALVVDQDLIKCLNETLVQLNNKKVRFDIGRVKKLQSFESLEKTLYKLKYTRQRSFLQKLYDNWDICLLLVLNFIFAFYLGFFVLTFIAPENEYSVNFYEFHANAYGVAIKQWFQIRGLGEDLETEECAIPIPSAIAPILRPIDTCDMCIGLTEIKRVEDISKEEFLEKYAYTAVPVIVTDAMKNWTGMTEITFDFLRDLYAKSDEVNYQKRQAKINKTNKLKSIISTFKSIVETDEIRSTDKDTCQFFPYKTNFRNLREVFELETNSANGYDKPWYVGWSNCNGYAAEVLRSHYERPYFLPDESEMSRLDWIFMGTPNYGAAMHIDDVNNPSWQAQISGIKLWTFKPPAECMFKCSTLHVDVLPGDVIVFDSNRWYHSTHIKGTEISLTIGSEYD